MSVKSEAEELLNRSLADAGFCPVREYEFTDVRKWRLDFAWPKIKLAVEVHGAGRHNRMKGQREDMQKINAATELGWRVLCYQAGSVKTHKRRERIVEQIVRIICSVSCPESAAVVLSGD